MTDRVRKWKASGEVGLKRESYEVPKLQSCWHDDGFMPGPLGFRGGGGVAWSERSGVRGQEAEGLRGGGAQLQGRGLNLARAVMLINVARVNPTGKDQLLDRFLTGLNQQEFNEQQKSYLN